MRSGAGWALVTASVALVSIVNACGSVTAEGTGGRGGSAATGGAGGAAGTSGTAGTAGSGATAGGTATTLNDGLVSYWAFDQAGTSFPDLSGNGDSFPCITSDWTANGKVGGGLDFTGPLAARGANSPVAVNSIQTAITIASWVLQPSAGQVRTLVSRNLQTGFYWKLGFGDTGGLRLTLGPQVVQATGTGDPTRWVHVAGTYDGATARLYIDGVAVTTASVGAVSLAGGPAGVNMGYAPMVGASFDYQSSVIFEYYGGIADEMMLYNRALTDAEIGALAHGALPARH